MSLYPCGICLSPAAGYLLVSFKMPIFSCLLLHPKETIVYNPLPLMNITRTPTYFPGGQLGFNGKGNGLQCQSERLYSASVRRTSDIKWSCNCSTSVSLLLPWFYGEFTTVTAGFSRGSTIPTELGAPTAFGVIAVSQGTSYVLMGLTMLDLLSNSKEPLAGCFGRYRMVYAFLDEEFVILLLETRVQLHYYCILLSGCFERVFDPSLGKHLASRSAFTCLKTHQVGLFHKCQYMSIDTIPFYLHALYLETTWNNHRMHEKHDETSICLQNMAKNQNPKPTDQSTYPSCSHEQDVDVCLPIHLS